MSMRSKMKKVSSTKCKLDYNIVTVVACKPDDSKGKSIFATFVGQ